MTNQPEMVEIIDDTPVKYVVHTWQRQRVHVPIQAVRRICEECGENYWAWPNDFGGTCAKCRANHNTGGNHE